MVSKASEWSGQRLWLCHHDKVHPVHLMNVEHGCRSSDQAESTWDTALGMYTVQPVLNIAVAFMIRKRTHSAHGWIRSSDLVISRTAVLLLLSASTINDTEQ